MANARASLLITDYTLPISQFVNKKFELMLTRRTKAYSSSGSVV